MLWAAKSESHLLQKTLRQIFYRPKLPTGKCKMLCFVFPSQLCPCSNSLSLCSEQLSQHSRYFTFKGCLRISLMISGPPCPPLMSHSHDLHLPPLYLFSEVFGCPWFVISRPLLLLPPLSLLQPVFVLRGLVHVSLLQRLGDVLP